MKKNKEYNHKKIEKKWQGYWSKKGFYRAKDFSKNPKFYVLDMFPYTSGYGLHVGHFKGYVASDIIARWKRMKGFNVLHPIGWDAFGLPAENYAIKTGIHPEITTNKNIEKIKKQMETTGLSYDWSREINTTDPDYYKWTQWIFIKLFEKGLAYKSVLPINWCPSCKTGLANEEVVQGKCDRCGKAVTKKNLEQWVLKITAFADRLLEDLGVLDWPEKIKEMQKNWIGKSHGVEVEFEIEESSETMNYPVLKGRGIPCGASSFGPTDRAKIKVFTTRIDTIFGVTAVVVAPDHPLVEKLVQEDKKKEVKDYIENSKLKSEFERTKLEKEKTGVFTGSYCKNPVNGEKVPVWVGDYIVAAYGGGAVMMVPAHDYRDYDFAKKYGLETKEVVSGGNVSKEAFVEYGKLVNSGQFTGLESDKAIEKISDWLKAKNLGKKTIQYKLRDWVFSRQRYWGEPIPIIYCEKCGAIPVSEKDLPLKLPKVKKYQPTGTGESPLATIEKWVETCCPKCKGTAKRETNTMPQWAGSCWYYLRYLDPENKKVFVDSKKEKYWMPVDLYIGGAEHAVLHLLYARFWHKFLFDLGLVSQKEPFQKLRNQGLISAQDGQKMSKSKGNVIAPDDIIEKYGADTLRVYEMFMGPFDQGIGWKEEGVKGANRFLHKFWNLILECKENKSSSDESQKMINKLNKKIDEDLEQMKFNTVMAGFMEFVNFAQRNKEKIGRDIIEKVLILFSPFAPHITEELWKELGNKKSVLLEDWPKCEQKFLKEEKIVLLIQINGKLRDQVQVLADISEEESKNLVLSREKIKKWIEGKEIKKIIFVPKRLINIVI